MNTLLKALALTAAWLVSSAALAGEAVPVNATFGIQWTPQGWNGDPTDQGNFLPWPDTFATEWVTTTEGAAGLANGTVIAIQSTDNLRPAQGTIDGEATLWFSYTDAVSVTYEGTAGFDMQTGTASYSGPMTVVGGTGRFEGASGTLTIRSNIFFHPFFSPVGGPYAGTLHIKGVIKTAK